MTLVAALVLSGCPIHPAEDVGQLDLPNSHLDLGLVPVEGTSTKVPLRNSGSMPVAVTGVTSSCGCVVAKAPSVIPPKSECFLEVKLAGQAQPSRRVSQIAIRTAPGAEKVLTLAYATGRIPGFHPKDVAVVRGPNGRLVVNALLWIYNSTDDYSLSIAATGDSGSDVPFEIEPHSDYETKAPSEVRVFRRGLHALRVRLNLTGMGSAVERVVDFTLKATTGSNSEKACLRIIERDRQGITVRPEEVTIACETRAQLVGKRRVFTLISSPSAKCRIAASPDFLKPVLTRLDSRTWKLDIIVARPVPAETSQVAVTVEVGDGDDVRTGKAIVHFYFVVEEP